MLMENDEGLTLSERIGRTRSKILFIEEAIMKGVELNLRAVHGDQSSSSEGLDLLLSGISRELYEIEKDMEKEEEKAGKTAGGAE